MSAVDPIDAAMDAYSAATDVGASRHAAGLAYLRAREAAYGHEDAGERADLLAGISRAAFALGLFRGAHEATVGLPDRALSDGTRPTDRLREALTRLRGMDKQELPL